MPFDIKTARPVQTLPTKKGFDIKTAKPVQDQGSIPGAMAVMGPLGRGVVAAQRGANLKDLPYIAAKTVSGVLGGVPEQVARNPVGAFTEAGSEIGRKKGLDIFPKANTPAGESVGNDLEKVGSLVDLGVVGSKAYPVAIKAATDVVRQGSREIKANLPMVKRFALKQAADRPKVLTGLQNVTRRMASKEATALRDSIKNETESLVLKLNQDSRAGALEAQKQLPKYFSRRSKEYGEALDKIFEAAGGKNKTIPSSEVAEALSKTAIDLGIDYAGVQSPIEQEIVSLAGKYAQQAAEQMPTRLDELIGIKRRIQNMVSSAKQAGTQPYGAGEHSLSSFRENIGSLLEKHLDGLRELNEGYAPFIRLKKQAVSTFKPFSGEFKTGENLLRRSGLPRFKGTQEDLLISQLERETGSKFSSEARKTGEKLYNLKESRSKGLGDIAAREEQRLIELQAKKNKGSRNLGEAAMQALRKGYKFASGRIL